MNGTHLAIEEFYKGESTDSILEKLKNMFELNHAFINLYDDEEYFSESEDGTIYNSRIEEILYKRDTNNITFPQILKLIEDIGTDLVNSYDSEGYGDFNMVHIKGEDKITVAISIQVYFI